MIGNVLNSRLGSGLNTQGDPDKDVVEDILCTHLDTCIKDSQPTFLDLRISYLHFKMFYWKIGMSVTTLKSTEDSRAQLDLNWRVKATNAHQLASSIRDHPILCSTTGSYSMPVRWYLTMTQVQD